MLNEKNAFCLLTSDRNVVTKNKTTFFVGMSMKVEKCKELASSQLKQGFDSIAGWLKL